MNDSCANGSLGRPQILMTRSASFKSLFTLHISSVVPFRLPRYLSHTLPYPFPGLNPLLLGSSCYPGGSFLLHLSFFISVNFPLSKKASDPPFDLCRTSSLTFYCLTALSFLFLNTQPSLVLQVVLIWFLPGILSTKPWTPFIYYTFTSTYLIPFVPNLVISSWCLKFVLVSISVVRIILKFFLLIFLCVLTLIFLDCILVNVICFFQTVFIPFLLYIINNNYGMILSSLSVQWFTFWVILLSQSLAWHTLSRDCNGTSWWWSWCIQIIIIQNV